MRPDDPHIGGGDIPVLGMDNPDTGSAADTRGAVRHMPGRRRNRTKKINRKELTNG